MRLLVGFGLHIKFFTTLEEYPDNFTETSIKYIETSITYTETSTNLTESFVYHLFTSYHVFTRHRLLNYCPFTTYLITPRGFVTFILTVIIFTSVNLSAKFMAFVIGLILGSCQFYSSNNYNKI